jgi:hypothetical protein
VTFSSRKLRLRLFASLLLFVTWPLFAQEPEQKPADTPQEKPATGNQTEKPMEGPQLPFQIQLLETHIRFEANGDSRKEVHTIVKIINILGARQFSRVAFDYNRAFQQIDIPLIRISHANGGTSELLPSAVTDAPNPAVEKFPAYQDVRVKSVRILGLQEGDTLEYRVITTTAHHPLAPDFWLEHTFDRSGQVLEEHYELDLPISLHIKPAINPDTPATSVDAEVAGSPSRMKYSWARQYAPGTSPPSDSETALNPDITLSTFRHWLVVSAKLAVALTPGFVPPDPQKSHRDQYTELQKFPLITEKVLAKAVELTKSANTQSETTRAIYDFVSGKITAVDLPLGASGFAVRPAEEILTSGYATQEDKFVLFESLAKAASLSVVPVLTGFCDYEAKATPRPSVFTHLDMVGGGPDIKFGMDPSLEVAPLGMVTPVKEKCVLSLNRANFLRLGTKGELIDSSLGVWTPAPTGSKLHASQKVTVNASIGLDGKLAAKVKYTLRGENELTLRVAFHQTPKDKWNDVANLLALSDGFRGQVTSVTVSDPKSTTDPFTVEYEITQPKFVDWTKKPVRIPALLPQIGVPDPPSRSPSGPDAPKIELGTPLDVDTHVTLHLPAGTTVEAPAGTSVTRDYATFSSTYSAKLNTLSATRHVNFLARELPADRAADYNAFFRTIQNDQTQRFTLFAPPTPAGESPKSPEKQKSSP